MSKGFAMDFKIGNKTKSIVQKGKLEPIEMTLGTRSGNQKTAAANAAPSTSMYQENM